jgi:hypothetical protein
VLAGALAGKSGLGLGRRLLGVQVAVRVGLELVHAVLGAEEVGLSLERQRLGLGLVDGHSAHRVGGTASHGQGDQGGEDHQPEDVEREILSAQFNGATLLVLGLLIIYEGIRRIIQPPYLGGTAVLIVALVGIVVNLAAAYTLSRATASR